MTTKGTHLVALCDFVAGASIRQIARRYRWTASIAEASVRRAIIEYVFASRPSRPERLTGGVAHDRDEPPA